MEAAASKDSPHLPGRHGQEDTAEKLRVESSQLLGVMPAKKQHDTSNGGGNRARPTGDETKVKGLQGFEYTVSAGDNLTQIARRMLKLRGEATSSRDIYDEVNRIVDLNSEKFPWLANNPHKIRPGMKIQVWDQDTGPDPSCKWKDWKDAEPGRITVALKCESIFAGKDTQVVVTPRSRAVFTPGSYGFVAPNGYARALDGSHVMAVGGDIIDDGGDLRVLHADTRIRTDAATRAKRAQAESKSLNNQSRQTTDAVEPETLEVPPI